MKQHLISKVLLRQFAGPNGDLWSFDLKHRSARPRSPSAVAWNSGFVTHDPESAESMWTRVENDLGKALIDLESGGPYSAETKQCLKSAVALHFTRRLHVRRDWDSSVERQLAMTALVDRIGSQFPRANAEFVAAEVSRQVRAESAEWFQDNITKLFLRVEKLASTGRLEVLEAVDGEFLIGDNAVLSVRDDGGVGVIPFSEAVTHVLPVSPRFLVALGPDDATFEADGDLIRQMNRMQILNASSHVFMRPGSGLHDFVLSERAKLV